MNLQSLLGANPIKAAPIKVFEEKKITKQDKDILDKVIEKGSKQGWLVKSRRMGERVPFVPAEQDQ